MDVRKYLDTHGIAWIPINIWENEGKKIPSVPKGEDQDWIHFKKEYTAAELKKIQKHFDSCNAIAIDTHKIHQMDIDEMSPEVVALQKDVPYFPSFSKGYPHFFSTSVKKQTKNCTAIPNCGDFLSGQWSYCRKDAVVHNAEKEFLVFDPTPAAAKSLTAEVAKIDAKDPKDIQKLIQKYVPNHAKTQVKSIKDNGSILTNGHYCFNVGRAHKSNHVWFRFVDGKLYQKCLDPDCSTSNYESEPFEITETVEAAEEDITPKVALRMVGEKFPGYLRMCGNNKMVYEKTTGMWMVNHYGAFLRMVWEAFEDVPDSAYDGGQKCVSELWSIVPSLLDDQEYFNKAALKTVGKLLFKNGIWDKITETKLEFSPDYYFVHSVPFAIPETKPENVDIVDKFYFTQPYPEPGVADWLRHDMMLALFGLGNNTLTIETGTGRNGKSKRADGFTRAFGSYVGTMAGDHIAMSTHTNAGGANPQIMPLKDKRLLYVSEPRKGMLVDMSIIKKITGNDPIAGRPLYGQVETFTSLARIHFTTNNVPKFSECEASFMERRMRQLDSNTRYIEGATEDIDNQIYPADDDLTKKVIDSSEALIWLMIKQPHIKNMSVPESIKISSRETIEEQDDLKKLFFANFQKDLNGKVFSKDIMEVLGVNSKFLAGRMLEWGFQKPKVIRIGTDSASGYSGIRRKTTYTSETCNP